MIEEEDGDKFGVIFILPEWAFSAELQRETIPGMMQDIDERLTEQGAPEETEVRCDMMMGNALAISNLIATQQIEQTSAIANIAYSFVYAFGKAIGFEQMDGLRGLTGSFIRETLLLNPCLNEFDYQRESAFLSKKMKDHQESGDEDWDFDISTPPTYH